MILDTDILIDLDRKHPPAVAWFSSLPLLPVVAGFAALEFKYGCRNKADLQRAEKFLSLFPVVWPNIAELDRILSECPPLYLSHRLGILDSLVAATAMSLSEPVATFNRKHFLLSQG